MFSAFYLFYIIFLFSGYTKIIKKLIKGGADYNTQGNFNHTPLIIASWKNHERAVKVLLKHKPHLEIREAHGLTALALASIKDNTDIEKMLQDARKK